MYEWSLTAGSCRYKRRDAAAPPYGRFLDLDDIPTGWYPQCMNPKPIEPTPSGGARSKLLEAAFSTIREKGYAATSVDELLRQGRRDEGCVLSSLSE